MPRFQDAQGNIWEAAGPDDPNPVFVGAAGPAPSATVAPNPVRVAREQQDAARQAARDASTASDRQADNARADAALALQQQTAQLNAEVKRLELEQKRAGGTPADAKEQRDRLSRLRQLARQINRVQGLYDSSVGTTSGVAGVVDYLPTDDNARFDAAGAALSQQGLAAFRVPGTGTVSDRDAMMFDRANLPTAATRDAAIEEQLLGLRARVEEELRTLGQPTPKWEGEPEDAGSLAPPEDDSPPGLEPANMGGNNTTTPWDNPNAPAAPMAASGESRIVRDAELSAQIDAMINAGAGESTINALLKAKNYDPLPLGSLTRAREWMKANPGKKYYGANATRSEDLGYLQQLAGSPLGAGLANYANTATAGTAAALAGEEGKGAIDAMRALNPSSSMLGQVLGGATGMIGAEAALAARAPAALAAYVPRATDALFGAATGFNEADDGEGLQGAAIGGAAGLVGGFLGDRAMRAVGRTLTGVRSPEVQYLRNQGVPMTAGQAVSQSGPVGATLKKVEDALTAVPGVGNMVEARQMDGLRAWNGSVFNRATEGTGIPIQNIGAAGVQDVRDAAQQTYRRLDGVSIDAADPELPNDLGVAINMANRQIASPAVREEALGALQSRIENIISEGDVITGRGFQEGYRGLGRSAREMANGMYGHEAGQVMRQGQNALAGALERQNPGAFDDFLAANATHRRGNVLAKALNPNAPDELITPAQLGRADFNSTGQLEGRLNAASGNGPFWDLARAGQQVLPSKLPDSGTATRLAVGSAATGLLGGGGYALGGTEGATQGAGTGAALSALLALGGTRTGQRALVSALLDRPDAAVTIGEAAIRNSRIGGWTGAGTLTPLLIGP